MESVVFYFLSGVSILSGLVVVLSPRPIYAVSALVACLLAGAGLYAMLGATLLAVVQVVVYAGIVALAFPIAIVLLDTSQSPPHKERQGVLPWLATPVALVLFVLLVQAIREPGETLSSAAMQPIRGSFLAIAALLVGDFAAPLLGTGVVVLSACIGAAWLARR